MAGKGGVLLNAVTATGAGRELAFDLPRKEHTVQVVITGGPAAVTVDLEGSLNGTEWFQLAEFIFSAGDLAAGQAMFHVTNKPVMDVRANLTTLTGGASPTVTARSVSGE